MISLFSLVDDGLSTLCWFLIIGVVYEDSVLSVIDEEVHRPPSEDEPSLIHFWFSSQLTIKIPISDVSLSSVLLTHELALLSVVSMAISDVSNVLHSLLLLWCTSCVTTSWVCCCVAITLLFAAVLAAASKVMAAVDDLVVDIVLNIEELCYG